MDELEVRLRNLREPDAGAEPIGLAERIHKGVSVRRRRRRYLAAAVMAGCAAAVVIVVPTVLGTGGERGDVATRVAVGGPDATDSVVVGGRTPAGDVFTPRALGDDGTVLGTSPDKRIWEAGAEGGTVRETGGKAEYGLASGQGIRTWVEPGEFELMCQTVGSAASRVSPQGARQNHSVWIDDGVIAGNDLMRQPWTAKGCAGLGKLVPNGGKMVLGDLVAFSYPDLFVVEPGNDKVLRQVDVESGQVTAERPLPEGVRVQTMADKDQVWDAAANREVFAWVVDGVLRIVDRASWGEIANIPGMRQDPQGQLSVGTRYVVYSTGQGSEIYDLRGGERLSVNGLAYAAGDWLLWRDGDDYRLSRKQ